MAEGVPEFVALALLVYAFATAWAARKLLAAIFTTLIDAVNAAHIPYLGGYIHDGLVKMEQAVDHAMGSIVNGIDSLMGATWHRMGQLNHWLWREFQQHSLIGWLLAQEVSALTHAFHYLRNSVHGLTGLHAWVNARVKSLEREFHGIEHKVRNLEREVAHGIGEDVLPRVKSLEHDVAGITSTAIPAIQQAEADAANAISNLYDWIKGKASILGVGTFALAVTAVLDSLGLANLRCPAFLRVLGRPACGLGNGLESLLGWFVDLFILTDLCEVIPLLEAAYEEVAAPAIGLLTSAIDAMPCVDGYQSPTLTVPALHLPSNPGFSLSLP